MLNRSNVQVAHPFKLTFQTQTWEERKDRSEEGPQLPTCEMGPKAEVRTMSES